MIPQGGIGTSSHSSTNIKRHQHVTKTQNLDMGKLHLQRLHATTESSPSPTKHVQSRPVINCMRRVPDLHYDVKAENKAVELNSLQR